jgi:hypothetical protein
MIYFLKSPLALNIALRAANVPHAPAQAAADALAADFMVLAEDGRRADESGRECGECAPCTSPAS